jgi:hypothetical protein
MTLARYASHEIDQPKADHTPAPSPTDDEIALAVAEAELERLRATVKTLEGALRCAAKVLAPYSGRAG